MNIINWINDKYIDIQLKKQFKINKKAPKVCMYCNKDLSKDKKYGIWVSADGKTEYECESCKEALIKIKEDFYKKSCVSFLYMDERPKEQWGQSIYRCFNCPKIDECTQELIKIEEEFNQREAKE